LCFFKPLIIVPPITLNNQNLPKSTTAYYVDSFDRKIKPPSNLDGSYKKRTTFAISFIHKSLYYVLGKYSKPGIQIHYQKPLMKFKIEAFLSNINRVHINHKNKNHCKINTFVQIQNSK